MVQYRQNTSRRRQIILAPRKPAPTEYALTIKERLRQAGLKVTQPRVLVLSLLHELGGHHSIDAIVHELKKRGTPVPRASVYNSISTLLSRELVMLTDAGPGPALYEPFVSWHHHFVCTQCGTIVDIPCIKGEKPCLLPDWVPGIVDEAQILFRGRCTHCLAHPI